MGQVFHFTKNTNQKLIGKLIFRCQKTSLSRVKKVRKPICIQRCKLPLNVTFSGGTNNQHMHVATFTVLLLEPDPFTHVTELWPSRGAVLVPQHTMLSISHPLPSPPGFVLGSPLCPGKHLSFLREGVCTGFSGEESPLNC